MILDYYGISQGVKAALAPSRTDVHQLGVRVWLFLRKWIVAHPGILDIPLDQLARDTQGFFSAGELALGLEMLRRRGDVREVYRVMDADGTLLPEEYDSLGKVPDSVEGKLKVVKTSETDVVPVYRLV